MFIKFIIYSLLIYFSFKIIRFVRAISASTVVKKKNENSRQKSYNEKDVIDVDFKEIKDEKENIRNDQ